MRLPHLSAKGWGRTMYGCIADLPQRAAEPYTLVTGCGLRRPVASLTLIAPHCCGFGRCRVYELTRHAFRRLGCPLTTFEPSPKRLVVFVFAWDTSLQQPL